MGVGVGEGEGKGKGEGEGEGKVKGKGMDAALSPWTKQAFRNLAGCTTRADMCPYALMRELR